MRKVRAAHECVARVGARQHRAEHAAFGQNAGHVFHGMHAHVHFSCQKRGFQFLSEQAFVPYLGKRHVQNAVAFRRDDAYVHLHVGKRSANSVGHMVGLPAGKAASARAYGDGAGSGSARVCSVAGGCAIGRSVVCRRVPHAVNLFLFVQAPPVAQDCSSQQERVVPKGKVSSPNR